MLSSRWYEEGIGELIHLIPQTSRSWVMPAKSVLGSKVKGADVGSWPSGSRRGWGQLTEDQAFPLW